MTPAVSKKMRRMKQMILGEGPLVQLLVERVHDNAKVMDLVLDISSHLQVTEAYIARKENAEGEQIQ